MNLIDKLNHAFFLIDSSGIIIYSSKSAYGILGYSQQELLGQDYHSILDCHQSHASSQIDAFLIQANKPFQKIDFELCKFIQKGNRFVYARATVQSLLLEEPSRIFIISFTDISEEIKLNEDVKRLNKKLDLIASLFSHQIRGPVATIIGLSNILNYSSPLDPINNEVITRISTPLRQLDEAISRIVALSSECELLIEEHSTNKAVNQ
ncbi:MAG: PAS domain S-box protein [Cyclobacteriaceae bacterium]|nr:PAS domain S-box protein [Cyclobacteriaceae bacterium]